MQFKSVFLAASLATLAYADSAVSTSQASSASATTSYSIASGCSFTTATATAQSDLDKLAGCSAIQGDIEINGSLGAASLNNVKAIYGSIIIDSATSLSSFSAGSLSTITDQLSLTNLTILSTLNLPLLSTVGSINFVTLPALSAINLNSGIQKINSLYISDTSLESLEGFDVSSLDVFNVNNNKNLNSIDAKLQNVKTALEVSYNSDEVEVSFDELEWANNITFRDVASISLAKLQSVNASLGFINNTFSSIDVPSLTQIGGSLAIISNDELEQIDLGNLTSIGGGFDVSNNTQLSNIDGFNQLQTVGGAIIFVGNFSNASLPSLKRVSGGVTIESDGQLDCTSFNNLDKKGSIQGDSYVCKGASTSTSVQGSSTAKAASSSTGSASATSASASASSTSSKSSKGDAGAVVVQAGSLLAGAGAFVLALL